MTKNQTVLVLEDDPGRIEFFKKWMGEEIDHTAYASECIKMLKRHRYNVLFLDHDLGGEVYVPSDNVSGFAVARWLAKHPGRKPHLVFLHSMNPVGRKNMLGELPDAIEIPFDQLVKAAFKKKGAPCVKTEAEQK